MRVPRRRVVVPGGGVPVDVGSVPPVPREPGPLVARRRGSVWYTIEALLGWLLVVAAMGAVAFSAYMMFRN